MLTRTTRRLVFYSLILAFLAIGTAAVFYAQGYRLDPGTFRVQKIGAIYVRTLPADSHISVGGESVERSFAFFDTGVFVSGLFPKRYEVAAERDGYRPWRQHVDVEPSRVVELKYVVLVPNVPTPITSGDAADFWMIGRTPLIQNASGTLVWNGRPIPGDRVDGWTDDENRLLTRLDRTGEYYWTDLGNGSSTALGSLLARAGVRPDRTVVLPDPRNSSRVVVHAPGGVSFYELQTNRLTRIATTTIPALAPEQLARSRTQFAWISRALDATSSVLYLTDAGSGASATSSVDISDNVTKLAWATDELLVLLTTNGTLYVYRPSPETLVGRANTVRDFSLSPDGTMLAALESQSIELFSLTSDDYWRLNIPDTSSIAKLSWYRDDRHLFLHYPDRVLFLDLDDRSLQGLIPVAETANAHYDPETNMLHYLADDSVFALAFPS